jgi:hypothetical protein
MSALRNVEDTIGGFVERTFGRLFRGHVQPVELARKLAREMEDHKTVSVSRVYVPNEYVVYLSPGDSDRFSSFAGALTTELGVYLTERARHEGFTLLSPPKIKLEVDTDLRLGEYGIACRVVDPPLEAPHEVDAATPDLPAPPLPPMAAPLPAPDTPHEPDGEPAGETPQTDIDAAAEPVVQPPDDAEPDPFLETAPPAPEGTLADDLPEGPVDVEVVDVEPGEVTAADEVASAPADAAPGASEPAAQAEDEVAAEPAEAPAVEPETVAVVESVAPPEPAPVPELVAAVEPTAPEPPPVPLPPPGGYEPLVGVSGTQILSAADAQAEGLVQEEMTLVVGDRRFRLTQRTTSVGRSRECDIVVHDANASRKHAEIRHIGLDYFIVDLGSTNGTVVNGQRIRRHALTNGDRITIGTTDIAVEHRT